MNKREYAVVISWFFSFKNIRKLVNKSIVN
jgi:hypothetical protein